MKKLTPLCPPRIALLASFLLMFLFGACQKPENDELLSPEPTTQFDNGKINGDDNDCALYQNFEAEFCWKLEINNAGNFITYFNDPSNSCRDCVGKPFIINGGGKQYTVQPYSRPDAGVDFLVTDGSTRYLLSNTTSTYVKQVKSSTAPNKNLSVVYRVAQEVLKSSYNMSQIGSKLGSAAQPFLLSDGTLKLNVSSNFSGDNLNTLSRYEIGNMCENQKRNVVNLYMEKLGFTSASSTYTYEYMINVALSNCGFSCSGNGLLSVASACADPICVFNGIMGQINANNTTDQEKIKKAFLQYGLGLSATEINDFMPYFAPIAADVMSDAVALNDPEFALNTLTLISIEPDYIWDRFVEFHNLFITENPNALLEACAINGDYSLSFWSDLATFIPPQTVLDRIESLGEDWRVQYFQTPTAAPNINFDYFPVEITQMPFINGVSGARYTPEAFFTYFRKNINNFVDTDNSSFDPYSQYDANLWQTNNPLTTVITIDIDFPGLDIGDDGTIICAQSESCCWIFATVTAPVFPAMTTDCQPDGWHPVSGNRQFGYSTNSNGNTVMYTKGADRFLHPIYPVLPLGGIGIANNLLAYLTEAAAFDGADLLWISLQNGITDYVNSHGGQASIIAPTTYRPAAGPTLKALFKSNQPINYVPCGN